MAPTTEKSEFSHVEISADMLDTKQLANISDNDISVNSGVDSEVRQYASEKAIHIDEATDKRLKKMIDKRVLTMMIGTYFLQALDKGTMSFASIMGIREDTGLVGQQYAWLTTCIYIAIVFVELPQNIIIQKVPIAKYLGFNIIAWGTILALHAACHNFAGLVVVRTLLGIFEAVCQPAFVLLSSMWYKREEQAQTVSYWYMMNGAQQIVGGLLAYCFTFIGDNHAIKSWQALFITYGAASVLWGIFVLYWMPDSPMKAKCWSEEDKKLMVERVRANQTGLQNKKWKWYQMREALSDPQTWCYGLIQVFTTLPTSGLGAFANIIIKSFNFSTLQTQLLAMVLGAYLIVILLGSAWLTKKFGKTVYIQIAFVIPSIIGTIVLVTVDNTTVATKAGLLCSYYLTLSFWATGTLGLSLVSRNIAGQSKRSTVVTINFLSWALGNSIGPQVFRADDAPKYHTAFFTHIGCYIALILTLIFLRINLGRRNKAKAQALADGTAQADPNLTNAFADLTDKENPNFVYIY